MAEGQYSVKLWKTISSTSRYILWTETTAASRVMDVKLHLAENYPKRVELVLDNCQQPAATNLMSASCTLWDTGAAGALDVGDRVELGLPLKATGTVTTCFYGVVADVRQDSQGVLRVNAVDWLAALDQHREDVIVFGSYRDQIAAPVLFVSASNQYIINVPDATASYPFVNLEVSGTLSVLEIATQSDASTTTIVGHEVAQPFIPEGDTFLGCVAFVGATTFTTCVASLHEDDGSGAPATAALWSQAQSINGGGAGAWYHWHIALYDPAISIVSGKAYWLKFTAGAAVNIIVGTRTAPTYAYNYYDRWNGSAWANITGATLACQIGIGKWSVIPSSEYEVHALDSIIVLSKPPLPLMAATYGTTIPGGFLVDAYGHARLSYYYGSVASSTTLENLIELDPGLTFSGYASMTTWGTVPLFRSRGKAFSEALRELLDQYIYTYSGTTYQGVMSHSGSEGASQLIRVHARKPLSAASTWTFSYALDTSTDSERVIVSSDLMRTNKRPAGVMVVGKSADGFPLCAYRDDEALKTGSFYTKVKMPVISRYVDESINSLDQANAVAIAMLDHAARDVWEGTIQLSGCYPDVFDLSTSSAYCGSGQIITLNDSRIGTSGLKLKVKSAVVGLFSTEITVSNIDPLLENNLQASISRGKRGELFNSPEYQGRNVFCRVGYVGDPITSATLYMVLKSGSDEVTSRVKCTRYAMPAYNTVVYHAEFETGDRTSLASSSPVNGVALYTPAPGDSLENAQTLTQLARVWKWKTTRVIVDFICWDGT